jgi:hypothetical protein
MEEYATLQWKEYRKATKLMGLAKPRSGLPKTLTKLNPKPKPLRSWDSPNVASVCVKRDMV